MRSDLALSTTDNPFLPLKKISRENLQNLCQVQLYAAEEAPSMLGTSLQEQYQAKEMKFLHYIKPLSESDLPPGFVNFAARQIGKGKSYNNEMDAQVRWSCPERILSKAAWQVATGNESTVVTSEQRRELTVPEAVYLSASLLPISPLDPLEASVDSKDIIVPQVPLFCPEDEEELERGTRIGVAESPTKAVEGTHTHKRPAALSDSSDALFRSPASQNDERLNGSFMSDIDSSVAAAAAAAYAVIKAKEKGTLVDNDLLKKILTNPILIKTLLPSHRSVGVQLQDLSRRLNDGVHRIPGDNDLARSFRSNTMGSGGLASATSLGSRASVSAVESVPEARNMQAWSSPGFGNSRTFTSSRPEDSFHGHADVQGSVFSNSGSLVHQHGRERSRNESLSRGMTEIDFIGNMKHLSSTERHRAPSMGSLSDIGAGSQYNSVSIHGRGEGLSHAKSGSESSQSRFQKPCIYFNTPKGCRRGTSCFYIHSLPSEQPYNEQQKTDYFSFQSLKRQKFGVPDRS
ncbi:hypothetical protein KP509_04G030200 [Ceratopteris richardii]|uniref:C3H1-type domain-containing protein n=2 Tax=Ceratopteris richardii TaxID=49495 RepID=A0A8T2UYX5_CERRI|nr:hypothetical protein KP509_04G030200 [Ceratopteris richardii]KAH7438755.1 hypothetical protein KP509_04G030200 [Ceratopteris richardii]